MNDNNRQVTAAHVGGAAGSGLPGMPNRSYVFDNMGNRTSAVKDGVTTGYTPNSVNAYAAVGGVNRSHDLNGNPTNDGTKIYTWEQHERRTTVTSGGSVVGAYSYDAFGHRTSRRWTDPATGLTRTTRHVYDGWNVVAEHSTAPSDPNGPVTLQRRYVWGQDLSGTMQGAGGVGGLLMIEDRTTGTPQAHYVCHDENGNVIKLITQDSGGNNVISAAYTYDPFGNVRTATGPYASTNPVRFSTKFQDPETGWNYYGYRYYDAANGRWPSRDPIEEEGGMNLNSMVINNPVSEIDVLGLKKPCCKIKGKKVEYDPATQCCRATSYDLYELIDKRKCTTKITFAHSHAFNPKGIGFNTRRGDPASCISCFRKNTYNAIEEANPGINVPPHSGPRANGPHYPNPSVDPGEPFGPFNPGRGDSKLEDGFLEELANAEQEAANQCRADCCSSVEIVVIPQGKAGDSVTRILQWYAHKNFPRDKTNYDDGGGKYMHRTIPCE